CGFIRSCVLLTVSISFFFNYSATTASSTLSLHDALPIWSHRYWSVYRARFEPEPAGFQRCRDPFGAAQRDDQHGEHQPHGFFHRKFRFAFPVPFGTTLAHELGGTDGVPLAREAQQQLVSGQDGESDGGGQFQVSVERAHQVNRWR